MTGKMTRKKCTVYAHYPWDHSKEERRQGVVMWIPESMEELIKEAKKHLKCPAGSCILLSENGGRILDINMISNDQRLFLVIGT